MPSSTSVAVDETPKPEPMGCCGVGIRTSYDGGTESSPFRPDLSGEFSASLGGRARVVRRRVEVGRRMAQRQTEPLRSDAQLNRDRILAVALEALTASTTASLNSIAQQAGVGIGTLYRHFPTREALVLEVYRNEVQNVVNAAPELLATMPPFDALRAWMELVAHYGMAKAGLADALSNATTYEGSRPRPTARWSVRSHCSCRPTRRAHTIRAGRRSR